MAKEIPYGVNDFVEVKRSDLYYVDKTMYIQELEKAGRFLFFIRPRRFGKSLLLSMLAAYYDIAKKDQFQELFGNLYIGQNPTKEQGQFQVLTLDFSQVSGTGDELEASFNEYCLRCLQDFIQTYQEYYPDFIFNQIINTPSAADALTIICRNAKRLGYHLYLILDEYDNFTNNVLNEQGHEAYHALTHATGFYRDYFKKFKSNFERIIMTGVSPVTLDDVTSGYNISTNISIDPTFNSLLGFSTDDVRTMFEYYQNEGVLKGNIDDMIAEMKPWYDNYCFAEECLDQPHVFNSDMVLYYLKEQINHGTAPKNMVDENTRTDYKKMKKLLDWDHLDGDRKKVIEQIAQEGQIVVEIAQQFPADQIMNPDIFPSLLYYYGMLTIQGTMGAMLVMGIPNNNVRVQYYEYLLNMYKEYCSISAKDLGMLFYNTAINGDWQSLMQYIGNRYAEMSSVRDQIEGERNIQGFFMGIMSQFRYYLVAPEMEMNHGYSDIFLMPDHTRYPGVAHSYIIELKHLKAKDFEAKAEEQWKEAVDQALNYAQAERVRVLRNGTQLHCLVVQFKGYELARMEEVNEVIKMPE